MESYSSRRATSLAKGSKKPGSTRSRPGNYHTGPKLEIGKTAPTIPKTQQYVAYLVISTKGPKKLCGWALLVISPLPKGPSLGPTTKIWVRPISIFLLGLLSSALILSHHRHPLPPPMCDATTTRPTPLPQRSPTVHKCINQPLMSKRGVDAEHRRCGRVSALAPEMRERWTQTRHFQLATQIWEGRGKLIWTFIKK